MSNTEHDDDRLLKAHLDFTIGLEGRYEDMVWKEWDTIEDRSKPGWPGHTPIYPSDESFFGMFKELCADLGQQDPTIFPRDDVRVPSDLMNDDLLFDDDYKPLAGEDDELGDDDLEPDTHSSPDLDDLNPGNMREFFYMIDDEGLKRNQAVIMAVMLGMDDPEANQFLQQAFRSYKYLHEDNPNAWWGTLSLKEAREAWQEKIKELSPNYEEMLSLREADVPEPDVPEPEKPKAKKKKTGTKTAEAAAATVAAAAAAADELEEPEEEVGEEPAEGAVQKTAKEPREPKRRGRPRKEKSEGDATPKRRGRPPKEKKEAPPAAEEETVEVETPAPEEIDASQVQSHTIRFPEHGSFEEKVETMVNESIGEDKNFPDAVIFLRTLLKMARSQEGIDVSDTRLMSPGEGLSRNEACIYFAALNINLRDRSRFMQEAETAFEDGAYGAEMKEAWHRVDNPIDEDLLRVVRTDLVVAAMEDERDKVPMDFKPEAPSTPKEPEPTEPPAAVVKEVQETPPVVTQPEEPPAEVEVPPPVSDNVPVAEEPEVTLGDAEPETADTPAPDSPEEPPSTHEDVAEPLVVAGAVGAAAAAATDAAEQEEPEEPVADEPEADEVAPPEEPEPDEPVKAAAPKPEPKPKPKAEPKPPSPPKEKPEEVPAMSEEGMRRGQKAAIEEARAAFEGMEKYDADKVTEVATTLVLKLIEHSRLNVGWKAKKLKDASGGIISDQAFQSLLNGKTQLNPESFAATGAVETLVPALLLDQENVDEVKNYLSTIPIRAIQSPGHDILQYAKDHDASIGDVMRLLRLHHRKDIKGFSEDVLGVKKHIFSSISMGNCKRVLGQVDVVDVASDALGLTEEEDKLLFRKMAIGIPLDVTQETLKAIFVAPPPTHPDVTDAQPAEPRKYTIDLDATDRGRTVAFSRFYELLMRLHGKRDFNELADAIATSQGLGDSMKSELARVMNNSGGRGGFDEAAEEKMREKGHKVLKPNLAQHIVNFAFPDADDDDARRLAMEFLTSEDKYLKDRSQALKDAWVTRRGNKTGNTSGYGGGPPST